LQRPIHNFIETHIDHLSKHLAGILGPSHIVVPFNPLCSHFLLCSQLHTHYSILLEYYILLQTCHLLTVSNYRLKNNILYTNPANQISHTQTWAINT
jgi:hypothetical protein